jgi:hypothetical protein
MMSGALLPFSPVKTEKKLRNMKQFACKQCNKTFLYLYNLKRHTRLKHPGQLESNEKYEIKEEPKDLVKKEKRKAIPVVISEPVISNEKATTPFPSHVYRFPREDALLIVSICQKCLHANQPLADQIKWFHSKFQAKREKEQKEKVRDPLTAKDRHVFFR